MYKVLWDKENRWLALSLMFRGIFRKKFTDVRVKKWITPFNPTMFLPHTRDWNKPPCLVFHSHKNVCSYFHQMQILLFVTLKKALYFALDWEKWKELEPNIEWLGPCNESILGWPPQWTLKKLISKDFKGFEFRSRGQISM